MSSSILRRTALCAALATGAATMVVVPPSGAEESVAQPRTVDLTGTLFVIAGEQGEQDSYAVQLPNDQLISITADAAFDQDAVTGSRFIGRVTLPVVNGRTASMQTAARQGVPLEVTQATVHARPTASGPVTHRIAIAQTGNLGAYTQDTAQILAQIKTASDYWVDQADGKIVGYELPAALVPYTTTKTTVASGCGLAGDQVSAPEFAPVIQEATTLFPGYDFTNGTDQLVVLMPDVCAQAFLGRGNVGDSVVSGGVSIVTAGSRLADTQAHEWGHNYGLAHANTALEYGDIYQVMGSAANTTPPELGSGYRHEEGLLQAGELANLTGSNGSATIQDRAALAESGVRGAELIDPDTGARLWFDLRTGVGSDAGAAYLGGITAYGGQTYRAAGVVVEQDLDRGLRLALPGGNTALAAGETWSNASGTMKVGVSAIAGGAATLNTTYAPGAAVTGGSATIAGTVRAFEKVTADVGAFVPAATGVRYQWFANGSPIPNEESATFDIPLSLAGASLSVQVTGYATGQAPSAPVTSPSAKVGAAIFYSQAGTSNRLVVSGKAKTGQVLSTTGLSWVGDDGIAPAGLASTFQWYRGRKPIKGATGATYRLKPADRRQFIGVHNIAAAPGFENGVATSDSSKRVKTGKLPSSKPKIKFKGKKAKVGSKLKVKTGAWVSKVKFRFQWYAGGRKIRGADNKTLKVSRGLRKKKITVKVSGSKKGYKATSRKSDKVKIR